MTTKYSTSAPVSAKHDLAFWAYLLDWVGFAVSTIFHVLDRRLLQANLYLLAAVAFMYLASKQLEYINFFAR